MLESIDRAGVIGWGTIITVIALAIFLIVDARFQLGINV